MRCLLVALGLIGLLSPALAADYDLPTLRGTETTFLPAFPRYFNWQGFYVGGQATYSSASSDFSTATQPLVAFSLRNSTILAQMSPDQWPVLTVRDTSAAGFGGFMGYNFQWDTAIIGLELNYTHSALDAGAQSFPIARSQVFGGFNNAVSLTASGAVNISDFITTRARFGWSINNFMPYATVGLAFGRADMALATNVDVKQLDPNTNALVAEFVFPMNQAKEGAYLYGYSGGGGLEFALTQNIFARGEYEYIQWARIWSINSSMHNFRGGLGVKF